MLTIKILTKKQKLNALDEIALFSPGLTKQKFAVKFKEIKTAMLEAYALISDSNMLAIIDQIDQLLNGQANVINANKEISIMQQKFDKITAKIEKI